MRKGRLLLALAVAIGLAPGTWIRSPLPPVNLTAPVTIAEVMVGAPQVGAMRIERAWHLASENDRFGGFSALLVRGDTPNLLLGSDAGQLLEFAAPDVGRQFAATFGLFREGTRTERRDADLESLAHDPETGTIWGAYENANAIFAYAADFRELDAATPSAIAEWGTNSGAEGLERLEDGRFIALSEGADGWGSDTYPGVIFDGDPVAGAKATQFSYRPPSSYRPVGLTTLPDGRALILLRRFYLEWPLRFASAIVVADPATIVSGSIWEGETIAMMDGHTLSENYEGIATSQQADSSPAIWLISDDNFSPNQRTLLLKLSWPETEPRQSAGGHEKAR